LILFMGVAGSGKTTLAREITRRVWTVYLDNNHMADAFFPSTRIGPKYEELRPGFYRALYAITAENLLLNNTVLLDVPHIKEVQSPTWCSFIQKLAGSNGASLIIVRCLTSAEVLRQRISTRGERRDRWKLAHWKRFLESQPINVSIPLPHLDVNTEQSLPLNITAIMRYIRSRTRSD
jgi:predicted kinase